MRALRLGIFTAVLTVPLLGVSPARAEGDFYGSWHTNQGEEMHIWREGDRARGDYNLKDGRLAGHIDGDRFEGIWTQSSSGRECYESRMGARYWGRFFLNLSEDGDHFHGRWSYCDEPAGSGGEWWGERRRHHDRD